MGLGDKAAAFASLEQLMTKLRIEKDALSGPASIDGPRQGRGANRGGNSPGCAPIKN